MIKEWHPSRNGNISPYNFSYGSHKLVWWKCLKCEGEWKAYIFNRAIHSQGCPYCSGKRISKRNSLAVNYPALVNEWHPSRNGNLNPDNFSYGSNRKVWWRCRECDGVWEAYIPNRTIHGQGCPYCSGTRVSDRNSLAVNYPDLVNEWDYANNGVLKPEDISFGSTRKVNWICPVCGYKWPCVIADRVRRGTKCPRCTDRITSKEHPSKNCLALASPENVDEWHPTKNGDLTPWDVTKKSGRSAWWICKVCNEEFEALISNRTRPGRQCPVCSNKEIVRHNSLGALYPGLEKEWDYQNNQESPYEVASGTQKKYSWKCEEGHSWSASPNQRTNRKSGCPYCSGHLATEKWNLRVKFPDIAKELHPSKNHNLNPNEISPYSNKRLWWFCKKGHAWEDTVNHRTGSGRGCPKCYSQTSASEIRIYTELKVIFEALKHRHKVFDNECDIFVPDYKLAIEYDGYPWHQDKEYIDRNKERILNDNKIELIRVRDERLEKLKDEDLLIPKEINDISTIKNILIAIIKKVHLGKQHLQKIDTYLSTTSFQNESEFKSLMGQRKTALPGHSFAEKCPNAATEWDYEWNGDLRPDDIPYRSRYKAYFKCRRKGHVTLSTISNRAKGHGCSKCAIDSRATRPRENSFGALFPNKASYWDFGKNVGLSPHEIGPSSSKNIWLKCPNGHGWKTKPKNLTSKGDDSPTRCRDCRKLERI